MVVTSSAALFAFILIVVAIYLLIPLPTNLL